MTRQRRPGAVKRSDEWKARISAGLRREAAIRRARAFVTPADVLDLTRPKTATRPEMRPFLAAGADESEALLAAFGGADHVSPQRRALLDDFVRVGVVLRATLARYAQTGDAECASRVGTLAAVRRASLVAIGLDEHRVEHDLASYLVERAKDRSSPPAASPDAECVPAGDRPACASAAPEGDT